MSEPATIEMSVRPPAMWSVARAIAFRFGIILAAIIVLPFPLDALPKTSWLVERYSDLWEWLNRGFADVIGVTIPPTQVTGSGDTMAGYVGLLLELVLAVVGAGIWSAIDRKRTTYPRVARVAYTALRYWLGVVMLSYGFAKVFKTQFPTPSLLALDHRVGEMSPMGLLWTFMGFSTPYTVFGGLMECLGGMLLFWRRTTTLGALVVIGVMTNVVMLNYCYDVPVKIFSSTLVVVATVLVLPDARRLIGVVLGHAAPARPDLPRWSRRGEWIRRIVKVLFIGWVLFDQVHGQLEVEAMIDGPPLAFRGIYDVEGDPHWRRMIFDHFAGVRLASGEIAYYQAEIDEAKHSLTLKQKDAPIVFSFARPAADRIELDGTVALDGKGGPEHVHLVLHAVDADGFPLMTRGYHWVQEFPYNR